MIATKDIAKDEIIAFIPMEMLITIEKAKTCKICQRVIEEDYEELLFSEGKDNLFLTLYLLEQS